MNLKGTFETPNASKYLVQLCKHFAHKIEVDYTETEGTAEFPGGVARFHADETALTVDFDLKGPENVPNAKSVIDKHLERFAFRENFAQMTWVES